MRALIAYATKYGGTKLCAEKIAQKLPGEADLLALPGEADLSAYDAVIVGCSVYMAKPLKEAAAFCEKHSGALMERKLGLFLCCMQDLDKPVGQQLAQAYPKRLREHASVLGALGGVVDFGKLSRLDGLVMRLVAGSLRKRGGGDVLSTLSDERIARFAELLIKNP